MLLRLFIYINAAVFLFLIPYLEVGSTHVFNPDWPAHARLHEVWQLVTNGLASILAVILAWRGHNVRLGGIIALTINAGFLAALASSGLYGGGMAHSDGSELLVAGVNPASIILLTLSIGILAGIATYGRVRSA